MKGFGLLILTAFCLIMLITGCMKMCDSSTGSPVTPPPSDSTSVPPPDNNTNNTDTLILQPSNNSTEITYFGDGISVDQSGSTSPELACEYWTFNGTPIWMRSAVKFDYSALPANVDILNATLTLYSDESPSNGNFTDANYGEENGFWIQKITSPMNTENITWKTQPSTTIQSEISVPSVTESFKDVNADVTDMVAGMINTNSNYGFFIRLQNEDNLYTSRIFCSSKHSDNTKHPKLTIIYTLKK